MSVWDRRRSGRRHLPGKLPGRSSGHENLPRRHRNLPWSETWSRASSRHRRRPLAVVFGDSGISYGHFLANLPGKLSENISGHLPGNLPRSTAGNIAGNISRNIVWSVARSEAVALTCQEDLGRDGRLAWEVDLRLVLFLAVTLVKRSLGLKALLCEALGHAGASGIVRGALEALGAINVTFLMLIVVFMLLIVLIMVIVVLMLLLLMLLLLMLMLLRLLLLMLVLGMLLMLLMLLLLTVLLLLLLIVLVLLMLLLLLLLLLLLFLLLLLLLILRRGRQVRDVAPVHVHSARHLLVLIRLPGKLRRQLRPPYTLARVLPRSLPRQVYLLRGRQITILPLILLQRNDILSTFHLNSIFSTSLHVYVHR